MPRALTAESRIALSNDQASCELAGEMAIVNFANGVYYGIDATGARIWKLLARPTTLAEICNTLADIYDVERSTLESDVRTFVDELATHGLVEIA